MAHESRGFVSRSVTDRTITTGERATPDIATEGGMMNLVQTMPAAGVSAKGESSELVTIALFSLVGLLAGLVAAMNGVMPVDWL